MVAGGGVPGGPRYKVGGFGLAGRSNYKKGDWLRGVEWEIVYELVEFMVDC